MDQVVALASDSWRWVALPLLLVAGVTLALLLRGPAVTRWLAAYRALRRHDASAPGDEPAALPVALASATFGAAGVVSAATAVALGGMGAIVWLWLLGFLIAGLRYAETLLARTRPAERRAELDADTGSLVARLGADVSMPARALGVLTAIGLAATAVFGIAITHGVATREVADLLVPFSGGPITLGVAVLALGVAWFGRGRTILGWIAVASLAVVGLFGLATWFADPLRAITGLLTGVEDVFSGATEMLHHSGTTPRETAEAAFFVALPPLAMWLGFEGAIASRSQTATKDAASLSMVGVLVHVFLATVLGLGFLATGAYARRISNQVRPLDEVRIHEDGFETLSQRLEDARLWTGYVRILDGEPATEPGTFTTERGIITNEHLEERDGRALDAALRYRDGEIERALQPDEQHALATVDEARVASFRIRGRMLPVGASLFVASLDRVVGHGAASLALVALLLLSTTAVGAFGIALKSMAPARLPWAGYVAGALPAIGLVLASIELPGVGTAEVTAFGLASIGLLVVAVTLSLLTKAVEASRL